MGGRGASSRRSAAAQSNRSATVSNGADTRTARGASSASTTSHEQTIKAAREKLRDASLTRVGQSVTIDAGENGRATITLRRDPDVGREYVVKPSNGYTSSYANLSSAKDGVTRALRLDQPVNDEERRRARNNMLWMMRGR